MSKLEIYGRVSADGSRIDLPKRGLVNEWMKKNAGAYCSVVFSARKKRSNPQNDYYHAVVIPLLRSGINDLGHDLSVEEVHEFVKQRFNSVEVETDCGHSFTVPQSTTRLSTTEFSAMIERIQVFAAEVLGVFIPDPDVNWREKMGM